MLVLPTSWTHISMSYPKVSRSCHYQRYQPAQAAITKYRTQSSLSNKNLFSHSSEGWKTKARHQQIWFLLGLQTPAFCCVLIWSFLCVYMCLISLCVQFSLLVRLPVRLIKDSCLWPHFIWITSLKPFSTNTWHFEVLSLGYQHMNFERHRSAHGTLLSTFYQDSFWFFIFSHQSLLSLLWNTNILLGDNLLD